MGSEMCIRDSYRIVRYIPVSLGFVHRVFPKVRFWVRRGSLALALALALALTVPLAFPLALASTIVRKEPHRILQMPPHTPQHATTVSLGTRVR